MAITKRITMQHIGRCPRKSLVLEHYHDDGSCKCAEVEVVKLRARVAELEAQLAMTKAIRRSHGT